MLPLEPSAAHRRGDRDARSHQRGPARVRDRPQRRRALVRQLRHPVRRELRRGSARRSRSSGRPGRASRSATRASSTGFRTRRCAPRLFQDAASAHPDGCQRARRRFRRSAGWACPSSSGFAPPRSPICARSWRLYRQAWREAGHAGDPSVYLRIPVYVSTDGAGRDRRAAREPHALLRAPDRAGARGGRPRRRRPRRSPPARTPSAWRNLSYDDILTQEGGVRHPGRRDRSPDLAPGRARARRDHRRAESGRAHPARAGDAEPASASPTR